MTAPTRLGTGGPQFTLEMARGMSEATLQGHVLHTAVALGFLCYHTHDSRRSQPGFPDLTLVHPIRRRLIFAELKTERGSQRPKQHEWEQALRAAGHGEFYLWRPSHWLSGEITRVLQYRSAIPLSHQREASVTSVYPTHNEAFPVTNKATDRKGSR